MTPTLVQKTLTFEAAGQTFRADASESAYTEPELNPKLTELTDLMGGDLAEVLRHITIAEGQIEIAKVDHAEKADLIHLSFMLLKTPGILHHKHESLYRHHCKELLDRVASGMDTRYGTKAEVLAFLSESSLIAPLGQDASALYEKLFEEITGQTSPGYHIHESYRGAGDELLNKLQKKILDHERVVQGPGEPDIVERYEYNHQAGC